MTATSRINAYRQAVVSKLDASMPELAECKEQFGRFNLEDLDKAIIKCPAVRFAVLSAKLPAEPSAQPSAALSCAAFVITEGKDRDAQGWSIAEAVAVIAGNNAQLWGLVQLGAPTQLAITPVITGIVKNRNVSIMAVEFRQELRQLGVGIWDDEKHLLKELYVNDQAVDLVEPTAPGA